MNTEQALLAAIIAEPDEDMPRLAYADWLEENDQPERAEFIRVECQTARTDRDSPAYITLLRQAQRLRTAHEADWFGPLADERVADVIITHRGFVDTVCVAADGYTAHAELIATHAPLLRGLHVIASGNWRAFFESLGVSVIRELSFDDGIFDAEVAEELVMCDAASDLVELQLDRQPLEVDGMAALAASRLRNLERLSLSECGIGDRGAQELFTSEWLGNLRELDLCENELTDDTCRALADASEFSRLEKLILCHNRIMAPGLAALATAAHLSRLQVLNLYANPLGPAGGRAILASRHWGGLKEINLIGCEVGIEVVNDLRWVYGQNAVKA